MRNFEVSQDQILGKSQYDNVNNQDIFDEHTLGQDSKKGKKN